MPIIEVFYSIYNPIAGGYWNAEYKLFRGIIFASKYHTKSAAKTVIENKIPVGNCCQIIEFYHT
jgi:hypothetical protein